MRQNISREGIGKTCSDLRRFMLFYVLLLSLVFLVSRSAADVYSPEYGDPLTWFEVAQYSVSTEYASGVDSPFFDGSSTFTEDYGSFTLAVDPPNKRVTIKGGDGFEQYVTSSGTYWVIPTWNNSTGSLSGPQGCFFNSAATYDSEVESYQGCRMIRDKRNQNDFSGLIAHGGVCKGARSSFSICGW